MPLPSSLKLFPNLSRSIIYNKYSNFPLHLKKVTEMALFTSNSNYCNCSSSNIQNIDSWSSALLITNEKITLSFNTYLFSLLSYSTESMMKFPHVCIYSKLGLEEAKVALSKHISSNEYLNNTIRRTYVLS